MRGQNANRARTVGALATLGAVVLSACGSTPTGPAGPERAGEPAAPAPPQVPSSTAADSDAALLDAKESQVAVSHSPLALITDEEVLRGLTRRGFDLGTLLGAAPQGRRGNNADLAENKGFAFLTQTLQEDVESVRRSDKYAGEDVARFSHRLFDIKRLRQEHAYFDLIAVVNRLDRRPFHGDPSGDKADACGEVRLIYRLAYATEVHPRGSDKSAPGKPVSSRLPMTIGLEFRGPGSQGDPLCQDALARFSPNPDLKGDALSEWLASDQGPLDSIATPENKELQVVVNLQVVRWPSTVHPQMAGHAEYVLRAFRPEKGGGLSRAPLENTPDLAKLRSSPALKKKLLDHLREKENLGALDEGTLQIPQEFLATKAVSVAPRGFSRRANRPFKTLFSDADFADVDFAEFALLGSAASTLRRLDDMTCMGCHQARSVAGFHLLGEDGPETVSGNALVVPVSPHVEEDIPRRQKLFEQIAAGADGDYSRAFAERGTRDGGYGAHCGLGGEFAEWTCAAGLTCDAYDAPADDRHVGICLPKEGPVVGDPCEVGQVKPHENGRRDRVVSVQKRSCVDSACNRNAVGFPGGVCRSSCSSPGPHGACGKLAMLGPFNACLARHEPFTDCLSNHAAPAGLRACGAGDPCRDDYVCARKSGSEGVCIPPYFLFQLRVDGHP